MNQVRLALHLLMIMTLIPYSVSFAQEAHLNSPTDIVNAQDLPLDPTGEMVTGTAALEELEDHKAEVFFVKGEVKMMKKGTDAWTLAEKGMTIDEGDQILTSEGGYIEIAYDKHYLDIARIGEKTRAEFLSIEPTNVLLEDGSIFSALDGLPKGSSYKVTTPTAVAAVRGTHFDVSFSSATKEFFAATIPVTDDGHESMIEVINLKPDGSEGPKALLNEGIQVKLEHNQMIDPQGLKPIDPIVMDQAKGHFDGMAQRVPNFRELREEGKILFVPMNEERKPLDQDHSNELSRNRDGEDRKAVGGPNGPDGPGGGPMEMKPGMQDDHFVDQMMNNENLTPPSMMTGPNELERRGGPMPPQGHHPNPPLEAPMDRPDPGQAIMHHQDPLKNLPPLDPSLTAREHFQGVMREQQDQIRHDKMPMNPYPGGTNPIPPNPNTQASQNPDPNQQY